MKISDYKKLTSIRDSLKVKFTHPRIQACKKPKVFIPVILLLTATTYFAFFHVDEDRAFSKGSSLYQSGDYKEAVEELKDARDVKNINLLGNSYNQLKKPKDSIKAYTKAVKKDNKNTTILLNRGSVYTKEGMYDKAEADFKKVMELDPKEPLGYVNLGVVYGETDRLFEALQLYKKAKKLGFKDADAYIENTNMMYQEDLQKMDKYGELTKVKEKKDKKKSENKDNDKPEKKEAK